MPKILSQTQSTIYFETKESFLGPFNPFHATGLFPYPLKTPENL